MKKITTLLPAVFLWALVCGPPTFGTPFKHDSRKKPNPVPAIFGRNIISTPCDEMSGSFTPDGKTCYFTMKSPSTIVSNIMVICFSRLKDGKWSEPEIAPFSGRYRDFNPTVSPDGQKLFFISNRPVDEKKKYDYDIWVAERSAEGWTEPKNIGTPVNSAGWELGCSAAKSGTLYFSTTGTTGNADLYYSKLRDGKYQEPVALGDAINSPYSETDPFIAPDESYILFASQGRPDAQSYPGASISYPRGDLYVSFFKEGKWTAAKNLGQTINSPAEESNPWVSSDGKTLYFTSERNLVSIPMKEKLNYSSLEKILHGLTNGLGNIYEVPVSTFISLK